MKIKVVVIKTASRERPPICPWVIDNVEVAPPRSPTK